MESFNLTDIIVATEVITLGEQPSHLNATFARMSRNLGTMKMDAVGMASESVGKANIFINRAETQ